VYFHTSSLLRIFGQWLNRRRVGANDRPSQEKLGSGLTPPHWCRTFLLLLVQMRYGLLCGLWVWRRRTNSQPCCPRMPNPSTSPWIARPDSSRWWDNWMAARHLSQDLVRPSTGLNIKLKRQRISSYSNRTLLELLILEIQQHPQYVLWDPALIRIPSVAIGNAEQHMRKASHCGSKQE